MPRPHLTYDTTNPGSLKAGGLGKIRTLLQMVTDCAGPDELTLVLDGGVSRSGGVAGLRRDLAALTGVGAWTETGGTFTWRLPPRVWNTPPPAGPALDDLATLGYQLRRLVSGSMRLRLGFSFLLEDPARGALLPYRDEDFAPGSPEMFSRLFFHDIGERLELHLVFPCERITDELVVFHDALSRLVETPLSRNKIKLRTRVQGDRVHQKPIAFERATYPLPPAIEAHHPALLETARVDPDDDAPRLVYGDWLTERGDPRGELIAVQCELARLADETPPSSRLCALRRREAQLLLVHGPRWLATPHLRSPILRRGFVDEGTLDACRDFDRLAPAIFAAAPLLTRLALFWDPDPAFAALLASPHFARIRGLRLRSVESLESLLRAADEVPHLQHLVIEQCEPSPDLVGRLDALVGLRSLALPGATPRPR
jgi:uncharacterized protein (TIGR02996 family)